MGTMCNNCTETIDNNKIVDLSAKQQVVEVDHVEDDIFPPAVQDVSKVEEMKYLDAQNKYRSASVKNRVSTM